MKNKVIFLMLIINSISSFTYGQLYNYTLKQNIVKLSECDNPKNGFIITGQTISHTANNDSFFLDIGKELFVWTDSKGTNTNKLFGFQSKKTELNTQYVFMTEYNLVRITTNQHNEAVIEIICTINNKWQCLSFLCFAK